MTTRAQALARRRRHLIAQSSAQRMQLALERDMLLRSEATLYTGLRILDRLRRHPEWIIGLAAGVALIKPRRLSLAMRLAAAGLRTWRQLGPALQRLAPPR